MKRLQSLFLAVLLLLSLLPSGYAVEAQNTDYTDSDFPVSFEIPEGWEETDFNKPKQILRLKLMRPDTPVLSIMYGCVDFYSQMKNEFPYVKRENVNMDFFNETESRVLAEAFSGSSEEFTYEEVGNHTFISIPFFASFSVFGLDLQSVIWHYMTIEQGFIIDFQYTGEKDSEYFPDFIGMLETLKLG